MSKEVFTKEYILEVFSIYQEKYGKLPPRSYWASSEGLCASETVKKKFESIEKFLTKLGWTPMEIKVYLKNTGRDAIQKGLNGIMRNNGRRI